MSRYVVEDNFEIGVAYNNHIRDMLLYLGIIQKGFDSEEEYKSEFNRIIKNGEEYYYVKKGQLYLKNYLNKKYKMSKINGRFSMKKIYRMHSKHKFSTRLRIPTNVDEIYEGLLELCMLSNRKIEYQIFDINKSYICNDMKSILRSCKEREKCDRSSEYSSFCTRHIFKEHERLLRNKGKDKIRNKLNVLNENMIMKIC